MEQKSPSVYVLGLRGFPNVQGGVETHAENLYPLVSRLGVDVTCATRTPFRDTSLSEWRGVRLLPVWSPRSAYFEAIVHSTLAVFRAAIRRPDIVHIHAVGPSLVAPLARLLGMRVVVTHHGPDYDREKWNRFARLVLRLGERAGMRFSNDRIVISDVIADMVRTRYGVESTVIPNGVPLPDLDADPKMLEPYGLEPGKYVLLVSRFVPEKRHIDLIRAFSTARLPGWKLALVGDADHPSDYVKKLREKAASVPGVVLTGFLKGDALKAIYQHAGIFVLPSSHEGLPISLLEALSYGLRCIASDIPANLCVRMEKGRYTTLGDVDALADTLQEMAQQPWSSADKEAVREWVARTYDWEKIAAATAQVYRRMVDDTGR